MLPPGGRFVVRPATAVALRRRAQQSTVGYGMARSGPAALGAMRGGAAPVTLATMDDVRGTQAAAAGGPGRPDWLREIGSLRELRWRADLALPAAIAVLQVGGGVAGRLHHGHAHLAVGGALNWLLIIAGPVALTLRRRHPVAVLWACFAATLSPAGTWLPHLSLIAAFLSAATRGHRRAAWVVVVAGYVTAVWLAPLAYRQPIGSLDFALQLAAWLLVLVIAAEAVRMRREHAADAAAARELDERRQYSEERLRMARDLHDVIGHNISLINVQASVGLDLMDSRPEQARAALAAIKTVSREALDELRGMLVALRQPGEEPPRAPSAAPGLGRLPGLAALTRAAGLPVSIEETGQVRPLPPQTDLAAYRIIQESLTNITRHARASRATVRLAYAADGLDIEVTDDGRPSGGTAPDGPGGPAAGGTGIGGMAERAAALGGRLEAGPRPGGGFAVTARLPIHDPPASQPAGQPGAQP
jgi:signal transduction histidine kinase